MSVKDINIKNQTYYFSDDIINIKDFDLNNIKIDEKSYKNTPIYYIGYVTIKKDLKMNGHFEEFNVNKYFTLAPTSESKEKIEKSTKTVD